MAEKRLRRKSIKAKAQKLKAKAASKNDRLGNQSLSKMTNENVQM